jgi:SAM-dependent methyltransferase
MREAPMQEYGKTFAGVYNRMWTHFALNLAPTLLAYYESDPTEHTQRKILDVCCGTGQLLLHFLDHGFTGTGIDLSADMLKHAEENCARYAAEGKVSFLRADAADFTLEGRYDFAVSTFDALNHLPSQAALWSCFECVHRALDPGAPFIFDLNTEKGLRRWNGVTVEDGEQIMLVNRGLYTRGMERAYTKITGFVRAADSWTRFEETAYNTVFPMAAVKEGLVKAGFSLVWFTTARNLSERAADPEELDRAFIVARG